MKNTLNILFFLLAGTLVYDNCDALRAGGSKVMGTAGKQNAKSIKKASGAVLTSEHVKTPKQEKKKQIIKDEIDEKVKKQKEEEERKRKEAEEKKKAEEERKLKEQQEKLFKSVANDLINLLSDKKSLVSDIVGKLTAAYICVQNGVDGSKYIELLKEFRNNFKNNWQLFMYGKMTVDFKFTDVNMACINPANWQRVRSILRETFTENNRNYTYESLYSTNGYNGSNLKTHEDNLKNKLKAIKE